MNLKLDEILPRLLFKTPREPQTYDALEKLVLSDLKAQDPSSHTPPADLPRKIKESVERLVTDGWLNKRFEAVVLSYLGIERLRAGVV